VEKVPFDIEGLDRILYGGIPKYHDISICGGPGTGKTLLSFEFIYRGALKGEPGVFISLVESEESILENIKSTFKTWKDIDKLIENEKIFIVKPESLDVLALVDILEKYIVEHDVSRAVIDSATVLKTNFSEKSKYRQTIQELLSLISGLQCTTLLTYEYSSYERTNMLFSVEQFIADGIINLYNLQRAEKRVRALEVVKMRGTKYVEELVPFKINANGLEVYIGEKVF
jgi:circadian clock protein KaiC